MAIFIFIVIAESIILTGHYVVYKSVASFLIPPSAGHLDNIFKIAFIILAISFISASVISFRYYNKFSRIFYYLTATWMGFMLYLLAASCLSWIFFYLFKPSAQVSSMTLAILLGLAIIVGIYGLINATKPKITSIDVSLPNLPLAWQNKKAIFVSDMHFGQIRGKNFAEQIVKQVHDQHPEIVFLGGDFYDGTATDINQPAKIFGNLKTPLGTYFITGNHEEFNLTDIDNKFIQALEQNDITVLHNQKIDLAGLQVVGVDYASSQNSENYKKILQNLNIAKTQPSILLRHVPNKLDIAEQAGVSLQLSGHAHRGQQFPFGLLTHWVYKGYDYGLKKFGTMQEYTSSGVGTWGPPLKIGSKPEIVVINFH